jgi:hypothetical protein
VDRNTAKKFFQRLESVQLVEFLRFEMLRGKNAGIAFMRRESTYHKKNYTSASMGGSCPSEKIINIILIPHTAMQLPVNFFKSRPNVSILFPLRQLLNDPTLLTESVHHIIENRILLESKKIGYSRKYNATYNI